MWQKLVYAFFRAAFDAYFDAMAQPRKVLKEVDDDETNRVRDQFRDAVDRVREDGSNSSSFLDGPASDHA